MRELAETGSVLLPMSKARFETNAGSIVELMNMYSVDELAAIFKVSVKIARSLRFLFNHFYDDSIRAMAAVEAYDGVVYKHFKNAIGTRDIDYVQGLVRISSLLYGLLRPFDAIRPYRMEGFVRLSGSDERVDRYWRDVQTQTLIDDVQKAGGVLLYLASKEEQNAFWWKEVKNAVRVVDVEFLQYKGDKLRQVVVYTKMARGEMLRYMIENRVEDVGELKKFEWGGFRFAEESKEGVMRFICDSVFT